MKQEESHTVKETIFYSYANLAMAHSAITQNREKYDRTNYMIRAKLFKGLMNGSMNIGTIFDDEKIKLQTGQICNYCGATNYLTLDHIFPRKLGGKDNAENLIYTCKSCNSSKGKKDLMEWMNFKDKFPPLMILRRYLKLVFNYCLEHNLLEKNVCELKDINLPFRIDLLPIKFPAPNQLKLNTESKNIK